MKVKTSKERLSTWRVTARCGDKCPGTLEYTGTALMCDPPKYIHKCTKCGQRRDLDDLYPKIEYFPTGGI